MKLFHSFLFILFSLLSFFQCSQIKVVNLPNTNNYYASLSGSCVFIYYIQIIPDSNQLPQYFSNVGVESLSTESVLQIQVPNNSIYYYIKGNGVQSGIHQIAITYQYDGVTQQATVIDQFNCVLSPNTLTNTISPLVFQSDKRNIYFIMKLNFINLHLRFNEGSLMVRNSLPDEVNCALYQQNTITSYFMYCTLAGKSTTLSINDLNMLTYEIRLYGQVVFNINSIPMTLNSKSISAITYSTYPESRSLFQTNTKVQQLSGINNGFRSFLGNEPTNNIMYASGNESLYEIYCLYSFYNVSNIGYLFISEGVLGVNYGVGTYIPIPDPTPTPLLSNTTNLIGPGSELYVEFSKPLSKRNTKFSYLLGLLIFSLDMKFPVGCIDGLTTGASIFTNYYRGNIIVIETSVKVNNTIADTQKPVLVSVSVKALDYMTALYTLQITDDLSGVYSVSTSLFSFGVANLVDGTLLNGTFQVFVKYQLKNNSLDLQHPTNDFWICDYSGNCQLHGFSYFQIPQPFTSFPNTFSMSNLPTISFFKFSRNLIDLSSSSSTVTLAIAFSDPQYNNNPNIIIYFKPMYDITTREDQISSSIWDPISSMYLIPINLPMRLFAGPLSYSIIIPDVTLSNVELSLMLGSSATTLMIKSPNADRVPPMVTSVVVTSSIGSVLWNLQIQDSLNGLKRGIIRTRASNDYIDYEVQLNLTGKNIISDTYDISHHFNTNFDLKCPGDGIPYVSFSISYIELEDNGGAISIYNVDENNPDFINPLIKLSTPFPDLQMTCSDPVPTSISVISFNTNEMINVGSSSRIVNVSMTTSNFTFSPSHSPIIHLRGSIGDQFTCSPMIQYGAVGVDISSRCEIPYGFGYALPSGILFVSVYGLVDIYKNIYGFSSRGLISSGFNSTISVIFEQNSPIITYIPEIKYNSPKSLTIFGNQFKTGHRVAIYGLVSSEITYFDCRYIETSYIVVDIPAYKENLQIYISGLQNSNTVKVNLVGTPNNENTPQPVQCQGNPKCGGPSNGDCTSLGCICKNNWQGIDCLSRIINTTEPIINSTSPDINNGISTQSPNGQTVELKSLISITSLNEIDFSGKPVKQYPLELWTFTNLTESSNQVYNHYLYNKTIQTSTITTTDVKVYIQWYKIKSSVQFAGETLSMNPSTLKYRIEITSYPFASNLNTLELVFSASLQSTNSDSSTSCSYQENGNVVNENSEYMKLQVNSNSLYGRFVKRGIIDTRIQSVDNKFSDIKDTNSNSISKQTISILIPHYVSSVQLDPDFSLLIDSDTAESKPGSSCDSKSKGLTKNQLIGIIVGSVVGGFILITFIIVVVIKNTRNKKILKVGIKLRGMFGKN